MDDGASFGGGHGIRAVLGFLIDEHLVGIIRVRVNLSEEELLSLQGLPHESFRRNGFLFLLASLSSAMLLSVIKFDNLIIAFFNKGIGLIASEILLLGNLSL